MVAAPKYHSFSYSDPTFNGSRTVFVEMDYEIPTADIEIAISRKFQYHRLTAEHTITHNSKRRPTQESDDLISSGPSDMNDNVNTTRKLISSTTIISRPPRRPTSNRWCRPPAVGDSPHFASRAFACRSSALLLAASCSTHTATPRAGRHVEGKNLTLNY